MRKSLQRLFLILIVTLVFVSTQTHADTYQIIDESEINTSSDDNNTNETHEDPDEDDTNGNVTEEEVISEMPPVDEEETSGAEPETSLEAIDDHETALETIEDPIEQLPTNDAVTSYALKANEVIVTSFTELKSLIVNRGNGVYDTYYLGDNLVGLISGIRVPSGYSFTIDGTNPETQKRHTFNEYRSAAPADTISHAGTSPVSMTLRNINIEGQNYYGTIYTSGANENVKVIYDNVHYTGPQITHNIGGTAIYRNSIIKIGEKSYYSASQEVGEVKHVIFEGTVTLDQANGVGPVFTMTTSNTFTFKEGAQVNASSRRGMSSRTTASKILFEENAVLNFTQMAAPGTSAVFYFEGAQGSFIMRPGSALNVDRPFTTNTGESILYSAKLGTALIDGGTITHKHDGTHTGYGLFNLANMTLKNGATIELNIGKNLSFTPFDVTNFSDLVDSTITVNIGGSYDAAAPMIGLNSAVQTTTYNITNSKFHVEANIIGMYLVNVGTLNLNGADISIKALSQMKQNPFRQTKLSGMTNSTYHLDFGTFVPSGVIINRTTLDEFTLKDSTIIIRGNQIKNTVLLTSKFTAVGNSTIIVDSAGDISSSIIDTNAISDLNGLTLSVDAKGNYTPGIPMLNTQTIVPAKILNSKFVVNVNAMSSTLIGPHDDVTITDTAFNITTRGVMSSGIMDNYGAVIFKNSTLTLDINQLNNAYFTSSTIVFDNSKMHSTTMKTDMIREQGYLMANNLEVKNKSSITLLNKGVSASAINPNASSFTLNDSSLHFTSGIQKTPVMGAHTINIVNSLLNIEVDQMQPEAETIVTAGSLKSNESSLLISAKRGTFDSALSISENFTFIQTANSAEKRLLIMAPTAQTIIRTQQNPITIAIKSRQMNIWNTQNTGGLSNRPKIRYERDDSKIADLKMSYSFPVNREETVSITTNTFLSETWDNPQDTLSFKTSIMKMVSAGSYAITVDPFSLNDKMIKGTTESEAQLHLSYTTSNNTPASATADAEANGNFIMHTEPISRGDIKLEASALYLYHITPLSPVEGGTLRFGDKENTVTFGNLKVPNKETIFNRTSEMNIEIIDDRTTGSAWKLEIKLVGHLSDVDDVRPELTNALIYKQGEKKTVLQPNTPLEIANSQTHTQEVTKLSWSEDEGILLYIQEPWQVYTNTEYSAKIQWILSDLK